MDFAKRIKQISYSKLDKAKRYCEKNIVNKIKAKGMCLKYIAKRILSKDSSKLYKASFTHWNVISSVEGGKGELGQSRALEPFVSVIVLCSVKSADFRSASNTLP
jgi:hypothetical protein